ncbi:MAG: DUF5011 domain-containing protein [Firmicutes bacterium]|nr:DUF5011 domain-containing protein [Bacillota bacterium]
MKKLKRNSSAKKRNKIIFIIMLFLAFILLVLNRPVLASNTKVTFKSDIDTNIVLTDGYGKQYIGVLEANQDLIFSNLDYGVYTVSCINQMDVNFVSSNGTGVTDNQFELSSGNSNTTITVKNEQVIKSGFYGAAKKDNLFKVVISSCIITVNPEIENIMAGYTSYNPLHGVSAMDSVDGDITSKVSVDAANTNLNVNVPGTYTVTYKVTNSSGTQVTATRTVNVVAPPVLNTITAVEGQSGMNTIDLTPAYTGTADKLYYVAVDSAGGYTPANSAALINFVLNGTNANLGNTAVSGAHVARGVVDLGSSGTADILGLEKKIAGDAGLVGGVKYQIYAVIVNSSVLSDIAGGGAYSNMVNLGAGAAVLAQGFDSGFGTSASPYIIKNGTEFSHMNYSVYNTNANLNYQLNNNIDLSGFSSGVGWTPIGVAATPFVGTFDGNNHVISNLTITNTALTDVGLFGVSKGVIKNVGIDSSGVVKSTTATARVGGLVGTVTGGSITNCYSNATVSNTTGTDSVAGTGGLIGTINGGTAAAPVIISKSHSGGTVSGFQDVGGFIGDTASTPTTITVNIDQCYAAGNVTLITGAGYQVGGFIGRSNLATTITNCYAWGDVTSNGTGIHDRTGGFAGWVQDTTDIRDCYASGGVASNNTNGTNTNAGIGGFVGAATSANAKIRNCLALNDSVTSKLANTKFGKFIGFNNTGTNAIASNKNYANSAMICTGTATTGGVDLAPGPLPKTATPPAQSLLTVAFFADPNNWAPALGVWDTAIWNIVDGELPTLINNPPI